MHLYSEMIREELPKALFYDAIQLSDFATNKIRIKAENIMHC